MAVPSYTTDLADITLNEAIGTWVETGTWTTGTAPALEPDIFIEGSNSVAKYWTSGGGGGTASGAIFDAGSALTIPSPGGFFIWLYLQCPNNIGSEANGGLRAIMGDSATAFNGWTLGGNDTLSMGGWTCFPVDPAVTRQYVVGTPTEDSTRQWFGFGYLQTATAKGGVVSDALRYGRGRLSCEYGEAGSYATFSGAGTYDSATARRWGLLTTIDSGYLMQGLFQMGTATNAVDFRDSNVSILIPNTKRVISTFNLIEIRNALSRVDWTTVSIRALGTTARGNFTVIDNADVNIASCSFTDMGTFTLLAATAITNSTFQSCDTITAPGSDLRGTSVLTSRVAADAGALVWTDTTETDGKLDNMIFSKGTNAHHAISFASTTTDVDYTLRNIAFGTGFNAANGNNDSTFYVAATTGTVTINLIGCSGNLTYKSAGATVTIVNNPVTVTVTTKDVGGAAVGSANVFLKAASGGSGILPVSATVNTITRVNATTAEATHAAVHNMSTGDKVYIQGADQEAYNGVFTITLVGVASPTTMYRYTTLSDPGVNATGTLTATFVFLKGATDSGTGVLSMSRVITADQNVTGWARKHSTPPSYTPPNYKTSIISGTAFSVSGFSATVLLISDD